MDKFTNYQIARHDLVKDVNYDVEKAKQVWDFIMSDDTPVTLKIEVANKPDGIYFILPGGKCIHTSVATDVDKLSSIAVGVKLGNRFANVALKDKNDGEDIKLCKEYGGNEERFKKTFADAISDFDGIGNTKAMKSYLNPDIDLDENEYIPAVGEMHLILMHLNEINAALKKAGGDEIQHNCHWSSTECTTSNAWYVNFSSGFTFSSNKNYSTVVRPSVACELSNL